MSEIVYQNVSFAKNFDLVNQQESCNVEGKINITNPSADPIFNIYLKFTNVERLTTDFYNSAGRAGTMYSGGAGLKETITGVVDTTVNSHTLTLDMDNDGQTDYMYVTATQVVFNISSEPAAINIGFGGPDISGAPPVTLALAETDITGALGTYGNITITGDTTVANELNGSSQTIIVNEYATSAIILHVPELRGGNESIFIYNMSCFGQKPPLQVNTTYTNADHPSINKKVLAGYNWTLNQSVTNVNPVGTDITNINITMRPQNVVWNGSNFPFAFENLYAGQGDAGNVDTADPELWWWTPNGGTLAYGAANSEWIRYNMTAPYSVPFTSTYMALVENLTYSVNFLMSNLTLDSINASADIEFSEEKKIVRPADNINNTNVTWEIRPSVSSNVDIAFDLKKVSIWVSQNLDPQNYTGLNVTYSLTPGGAAFPEVNLTDSWGNSSYYWQFNFTDGSQPPIVWMKPEWLIADRYGQIVNMSTSVSGEDLYMKYIYVVSGYWLEIEKNITNVGEGMYRVNITVTNIGNGWTPQFEYVTVYDFVPNEFTPWNSTDSTALNQTVGTPGSDYYGLAQRYNIPWKGTMNASLGPSRGPNATSASNYSWTVAYTVNGTGTYKVTELYVVGLDPLKVEGAFTSPIITIISGIQTHSKELIYVAFIFFLVVVNISNLVITHRINSKISERLPPPPPPPRHR